ncbi:MAG: hypothetical protein GTO18_05565 [Anaerolineales bacterium]|nr:hypothetical protein [Anaerolineales bacterium]
MATDRDYQENINKGLDKAYEESPIQFIDISDIRLVIFSDHHKGNGDEADDFRQSKMAYRASLDYYLQAGHTLIVLGDVEELWENRPVPVLETYDTILELENEYHKRKRYLRFWGNHDDEWRNPSQVERHLGKFFDDLSVLECLRLKLLDGDEELGEFFFVHGHQGTVFSDRFGWLSRFFVRYIWRPFQRITKIKPNTPATDWRLRYEHDIAMYNWAAEKQGIVLIAGHTHHPIFPSTVSVDRLAEAYESIKDLSVYEDEIAQVQADLEFAQAQEQPAYFNDGCCCFSDGRITGIEIISGQIRLIRWPNDIGQPQPEILDSADLREVFEAVASSVEPIPIPVELE